MTLLELEQVAHLEAPLLEHLVAPLEHLEAPLLEQLVAPLELKQFVQHAQEPELIAMLVQERGLLKLGPLKLIQCALEVEKETLDLDEA